MADDNQMTWVKICGTTNLEDALVAVDAGADAVGFVFYEKSPRKIAVEAAREIVQKLPEGVEKIGVFVGGADAGWLDVFQRTGLTAVQHYLRVEPGVHPLRQSAIGMSLIPHCPRVFVALPSSSFLGDEEEAKAFAEDFEILRKEARRRSPPFASVIFDTFLLDSGTLGLPGGTGKTFDWKKVVPATETMRQGGLKVIVAGGLTPENVGDAIEILKPWGVDVASGVEARPGKKDPEKVRAFVRAVREKDRKAS
jgi:phosphoribosylanthranilate isomerase